MQVQWTEKGLIDVERLHSFLAQHDRELANAVVIRLDSAPTKLLLHPRLGERVEGYIAKEIRKLSIGRYVMHYEIAGERILILRVWHSREQRR